MSLTCLILAAGKGVRMKSFLPKPLHQVAHRPMISHCVAAAEALRPDRIVVVIGPGMETLAEVVKPHDTVLQAEPMGTGHAVQCAMTGSAGLTGEVLVLFGDTPLVTPATLQRLRERRQGADRPAVVVSGMYPPDPAGYGRLIAGGGSLMAIVEDRDANETQKTIKLCNGGIMLFDAAILPSLLRGLNNNNAKGEFYLTDTIALARRGGHACAHIEVPYEEVMGVNSRLELAAVESIMQQRLRARVMDNGVTLQDPASVHLSWDTQIEQDVTVGPHVVFGPGVKIDSNVEIRPYCHLEGVSIGSGTVVGPFARIRPGSRLNVGVHIGNFVEIKSADVAAGAKINHLSYIGDASVGAHANIGAGTITCNYDGFIKSRLEIGAGAFIGSNTALVAPVRIGADALVGAGSVITSDVPPDSLALSRASQQVVNQRGMASRRKQRQ